MKPLTERMIVVLRLLANTVQPMTGNQLGRAIGFHTGQDHGKHSHNGRAMGPAQRVIGSLNGLRARGLADLGSRPDGLSGTAYSITKAGQDWLKTNYKTAAQRFREGQGVPIMDFLVDGAFPRAK